MSPVIDKAVSTEDLCKKEASPALGVLRLDAILHTLVENKVESLKQENGKNSSIHSSPRSILQKLKCHPSPKPTLRVENEKKKDPRRKHRKDRAQSGNRVSESRQFKKQVLRQETSSPDSQILQESGHQCNDSSCVECSCTTHICYCNQGPIPTSDDFISIKMDGYGDVETDSILAQEELRRARRKRRRRRKRRLKKRLALNPHLVDTLGHESEFKTLNEDELPPRAKWTIVATACLLLFMCLLLVGITLRMAPIIDEIGSKRLRKTTSLEQIYQSKKTKYDQRRRSEYLFKDDVTGVERRHSSRKHRKKGSTKSRHVKRSYERDIEKGCLDSGSVDRARLHSESKSTSSCKALKSKEEEARQKRRRKIINIILAVYLFLFVVSILSVVVTLTHTSTVSDKNSTKNLTYYTFSPNPSV